MKLSESIRIYLNHLKLNRSSLAAKGARHEKQKWATFMAYEAFSTLVALNTEEVHKLMSAAGLKSNDGRRNRIILEIFYDTAIRQSELINIKIRHLNLDAGFIHVPGQGNRERMVPISLPVCRQIEHYLKEVRPRYIKGPDTGYLILNRSGRRMHPGSIRVVAQKCAELAGIEKQVSTHTLRHTCITHMLRNGSPVRHLQEMLGHNSRNDTRPTLFDLKLNHEIYHPGEI